MNASMGLDGFTERAQRELQATGEKVRSHTSQPSSELTPQEDQIAQQDHTVGDRAAAMALIAVRAGACPGDQNAVDEVQGAAPSRRMIFTVPGI
jgi:hypothetical protein